MPTLRIAIEGIEGIPDGTEITVKRTCNCGPGIIDTEGITVSDEAFPPSEPPSRLGGGPALRLLPPPESEEPHAVPLLEAM